MMITLYIVFHTSYPHRFLRLSGINDCFKRINPLSKDIVKRNGQTMSAAERVRRFREGKPTAREDRQKGGELWYIQQRDRDISASIEHEPPRTVPIAAKPIRKAHNDILAKLRQPTDYMSMNVNQRFSQDHRSSLDADEIITSEIRGLERENMIGTRMSIDSYDPRASAQYSDYEPVYRYNGAGGGFGVANRGPGGSKDAMRMSGGSDYLRSSVETLGSTGMPCTSPPPTSFFQREQYSLHTPVF